ncbi:ArsR/SmtB family transcription factor [Paenibacillus antri]|uniref:ArsR/SmtB family transcription factor n=1 Tax=Paenibacillus antri TaxID=2582848 RepID=UPI0013050B41|nr:winged helix-turn-helix domain-containing protein [Paenibacillus antri]
MDKRSIVRFHQALGDDVRLEILSLLRKEARTGSELARIQGLSHATISYHLDLLGEAKLLHYQRWGRAVSYRLASAVLESKGGESVRWLAEGEVFSAEHLFTGEGRLQRWPMKRSEQYETLKKIVGRLDADTFYPSEAMSAFMRDVFEEDPWTLI